MTEKYHPFPGQMLECVKLLDEAYENERERHMTRDLEHATTLTSVMADADGWRVRDTDGQAMHRPVIDVDVPVHLVPSTTPGHFHLYIDHPMRQEHYFALLDALADAGIVEPGYVGASRTRGHTSVRLPWIRKGEDAPRGGECVQPPEVTTSPAMRKALEASDPWRSTPEDGEPF